MGFPIRDLSIEQMKKLKNWHRSDNEARQKQLRQEILDGKEHTPIIITMDDVVIDGHGRLRAYMDLDKSIKAMILPFRFDNLREDGYLAYGASFNRLW